MKSRKLIRIVIATALVLMVPLLAMQVSDEMAWGPGDFALAGALLLGTGLMYELVSSRAHGTAYRLAAGLALATGVFLVWVNLAVGLIGSEDNPANVLYLGVLAVGVVGAAVGRLEPLGMARALFATALAQALVPVIAMMIGTPPMTSGLVKVLVLNAFFVALWVASGVLFRRATASLEVRSTA